MHFSHSVLFPNFESVQKLYRESKEHPMFCTFPMIATYFVILFLPVDSAIPNDEFFAEKWVLVVQMTDRILFKRLEGQLKIMMLVIIAMLPTVKFTAIWAFYISFYFHKNILK